MALGLCAFRAASDIPSAAQACAAEHHMIKYSQRAARPVRKGGGPADGALPTGPVCTPRRRRDTEIM